MRKHTKRTSFVVGFFIGLVLHHHPGFAQKKQKPLVVPKPVTKLFISVKGTVKDRQGKPVSGVTVFQSGDGPKRTENTTDAQGRFKVSGIPEGQAFLFAEKKGYRFTGQLIDTKKRSVNFELVTKDDPDPPLLKTLPTPDHEWTDECRKQLAWKIIKPEVERFIEKGDNVANFSYLSESNPIGLVAFLKPQLLVSELVHDPDKFINMGWITQNYLLGRVADNLAEDDLEESIALYRLTNRRLSMSYRYMSSKPNLPLQDRVYLLSEAKIRADVLRHARIQSLDVQELSFIADELVKLGFQDTAFGILVDAQKRIKKLKSVNFWGMVGFGVYANAWASLDFNVAMSLMKKGEFSYYPPLFRNGYEHSRQKVKETLFEFVRELSKADLRRSLDGIHYICFRIARDDPKWTQKVYEGAYRQMFNRSMRSHLGGTGEFKAAHKAVQKQGIANLLYKYALGYVSMSYQARTKDPAISRKFLNRGMRILFAMRNKSKIPNRFYVEVTPSRVLSIALPLAEKVDPALAYEAFWKTLSLRLPPIEELHIKSAHRDEALLLTAIMIGRYNRDAARTMVERIVKREMDRLSQKGLSKVSTSSSVLSKLYFIDPKMAWRWAESLPNVNPGISGPSPQWKAKTEFASEVLYPIRTAYRFRTYREKGWQKAINNLAMTRFVEN